MPIPIIKITKDQTINENGVVHYKETLPDGTEHGVTFVVVSSGEYCSEDAAIAGLKYEIDEAAEGAKRIYVLEDTKVISNWQYRKFKRRRRVFYAGTVIAWSYKELA